MRFRRSRSGKVREKIVGCLIVINNKTLFFIIIYYYIMCVMGVFFSRFCEVRVRGVRANSRVYYLHLSYRIHWKWYVYLLYMNNLIYIWGYTQRIVWIFVLAAYIFFSSVFLYQLLMRLCFYYARGDCESWYRYISSRARIINKLVKEGNAYIELHNVISKRLHYWFAHQRIFTAKY